MINKNSTDGTLTATQAQPLIQKGYLSEYVFLKLPVYDVDIVEGEIDKVTVNGVDVGVLTGSNNIWKLNEFKFPIWLLKFGKVDPYGGPSIASDNVIEIHIDTGGDSAPWCTEADWVSLSFKALSPVFFVHGNTSDGAFFTRNGFTTKLDEEGIVYDNSINLIPNNNEIKINASKLGLEFYNLSKKYGVDSFHVIVHSKGGLDTRAFIADYYTGNNGVYSKTFKIISFTSLGTPHNGAVLADLSSGYASAMKEYLSLRFPDLPAATELLTRLNFRFNGVNGGHKDLRTAEASSINRSQIPKLQQLLSDGTIQTTFNTVTADADKNGSQSIDQVSEWEELINDDPVLEGLYYILQRELATYTVNNLYQLTRQQKQIYYDVLRAQTAEGNSIRVAIFKGIPNPVSLGNDTLVNIESGRGKGFFENLTTHKVQLGALAGKNHSSIADAYVAGIVIPWFLEADRSNGDLK